MSRTLTAVAPKPLCIELHPGDLIQHRCIIRKKERVSLPQIIKRRKDDDSGWWLVDGSGIADFAFDGHDEWQQVDR